MYKNSDKIKFLKSKHIFLRPLSIDDDLSEYGEWINNQETTRFMGSGKFPHTPDSLKDYISRMNSSNNDILLGIFLNEDNMHIGNLTLEDIDWIHRKGELGIVIGNKDYLGKGYGREAINLMLKHCFNRLNLNRVSAGMVCLNMASTNLFEKCGFVLEGTLKNDFYFENKYYDVNRYGLLIDSYL